MSPTSTPLSIRSAINSGIRTLRTTSPMTMTGERNANILYSLTHFANRLIIWKQ